MSMAKSTNTEVSGDACPSASPPRQKLHSLTICLVPPPRFQEVWGSITKARVQFQDPGLYRWPPHVNLLYPFLNIKPKEDKGDIVEPEIRQRLEAATHAMRPFRVTLHRIGTFGGNHRGVLWLYPTSQYLDVQEEDEQQQQQQQQPNGDEIELVHQLYKMLEERFPECCDLRKGGRYSPHMTLSHFASLESALEAEKALQEWWTPIEFQVGEIYLLQRKGDDGQFQRVLTLPFGKGLSGTSILHDPAQVFPAMPEVEEEWVRQERMKLKERRNRGSRRRNGGGRRQGQGRGRGNGGRGPSRSRDTPEEIAAKRAARKAKRERLEREAAGEVSAEGDNQQHL